MTSLSPASMIAPHNFAPASSRDCVLHLAERPGNSPDKSAMIPTEIVTRWIDYMKDEGVGNVLILMDPDEYHVYEDPGLLNLYQADGLRCYIQSMQEPGAPRHVFQIIRDVQSRNEKLVAHCNAGRGRCGRVAAAWLVEEYGLTPERAMEEVVCHARGCGAQRKNDVARLRAWLGHD